MKMLVVNAGSSSLKFTVFDFSWLGKQKVLASGQVECIGLPVSYLIYKNRDNVKTKSELEVCSERKAKKDYINHEDAMKHVCEKLLHKDEGIIGNINEVIAIGHRAVHGGEKITKPVIVNDEVKKVMRDCFPLAPLHNPANLQGIEACEKIFPNVPNVAIFDTAFHQTMGPDAFLYAIPYELYKKYGYRKYGFHGTSHNYVANATANFLKVSLDELKMVTCHLGNGCSMAAINKGKVIDTSMGMTPVEGLMMGTRCGDLDPAIVLELAKQGNTTEQVDKILNKQSGLLGIAGIDSGDCRDVLQASDKGNKQCELAVNMFVRRIVKYLGAYSALLNGIDAIVFTGGIGEHSDTIREMVIDQVSSFNVGLNKQVNENCKGEAPTIISTKDSRLRVVVMPTNEELMIATQSIQLLLDENRLRLVAV
ncbi:MAG TPA: acetate kinase [Victivallales bacterium]|nr:acetate kinase [Victivallales bacterium]